MSLVHTDDNLIEARLRQLEARTSITGNLQPPPADFFWSEMPVVSTTRDVAPATPNRWLGPLLGIVVGSVVTQMITAFGSSDTHPPASQAASVQTATSAAPAATADPTTEALSRLIAARPAATSPSTPSTPTVRSIDPAEIIKLQQANKLTLGRKDPFAVIRREPSQPKVAALPPVQILMPDPPPAPMATLAPKPTSQVRFNGAFAMDGAYTALVEETALGQTFSRRWRQGDLVLGGYRVAEIGLRTLKLRMGSETILLSAGSSQDLESRASGSGLSAIAPEPVQPTGAKPAVWRPSPALPTRSTLSTPLATPLPPSVSEPPQVESEVVSVPSATAPPMKSVADVTTGTPPDAPMQ